MNILRKFRIEIRIVLTLMLAMLLGEWLLEGPAWRAYYKGMDLGPGGIGAPARADTPVARSIAEMEALDKFKLERVQTDWDDNEGGVRLDGDYYWLFTLQSGEKILIRYNLDADEYDPGKDYWGSPIGTWRTLELSERDQAILARETPDLADTGHYGDMLGNHEDAMDKAHFIRAYEIRTTLLLTAALAAVQVLVRKLRRRRAKDRMNVNRVQNDLELWLTGTYAIWAQFFAGMVLKDGEAAQKGPFYIGALPKTKETARAEKEMLADSWDIDSYESLLETVEYMSEGPGYRNCGGDPAGLAWELCRSMQLLGCAYLVGWCSREECIRRSCAVGKIMQKDFQSWEELCQGFLDGFSAWRLSGGRDPSSLAAVQQRADIYWAIRRREDSPYNLPWNMDLDPDKMKQ